MDTGDWITVSLTAALVGATAVFVPNDADGSPPADHRRWKSSVVASGEQQTFLPKGTNGGIADMEQLGNLYERVELRGAYEDVLGNRHLAESSTT